MRSDRPVSTSARVRHDHAGREAMFQMMGVFAEFKRAMIAERVRAGMARARENGTKSGNAIGRPRIDGKVEEEIRGVLSDNHIRAYQ